MIMMFLSEFRFIPGFLPADFHFLNKTAFTQQSQIPVDSRVAYAGIFCFHQDKKFINSNMLLCRKECIEDFLSLPRISQSFFPYVISKYVFSGIQKHIFPYR